MSSFSSIEKTLSFIEKNGLYPQIRTVSGPAEPETLVDGKKVLIFSSNNYLNLSSHPLVKKAAIAAIEKYGVGADGSRLLSGNLEIHQQFESAISNFKHGEAAIVWPTGYAANVGVISALMNPPKLAPTSMLLGMSCCIFSDELNHASIIDGARLSRQKVEVYRHNDMADLEKKVRKSRAKNKLIVTDGVFSMDGDIAPLRDISDIAKKYGAMSMVDEAHSTGVLGKSGRGTLEYYGLTPGKDIDIVLGTCSKALAATGGFVVASKSIVDYLRVMSRSYIFSTAMLPAASGALIAALDVIVHEPDLRERLWSNTKYLKGRLEELGFNTLGSQTQIIPILIGSEEKAIEISKRLFEEGVYAPTVRWPAVPKKMARLRVTLMSHHTKDHLDQLVGILSMLGLKYGIIK